MLFLKKVGKFFFWIVLTAILLWVGMKIAFVWYEQKNTVAVSGNIPDLFPILVISGGDQSPTAKAIYYRDLKNVTGQMSSYSFLVPKGKEELLNSQLRNQSRSLMSPPDFNSESDNPWFASFEVKEIAPGRQTIRLSNTWDDDRVNIGWYEATDKESFPKKYRYYFGGVFALLALGFSIFFTIVSLVLIRLVIRWKSHSVVAPS